MLENKKINKREALMSVLFPRTIPYVMCPMCSKHMRFVAFEPTQRDDSYKMTFDCACGFKYQFDLAAEALARNDADIRSAPT